MAPLSIACAKILPFELTAMAVTAPSYYPTVPPNNKESISSIFLKYSSSTFFISSYSTEKSHSSLYKIVAS